MTTPTRSEDEIIGIVIMFGNKKFNITTFRHELFLNVATCVCEVAGWHQSKTRFLVNGDRLQNNKTFLENGLDNNALIDVMFEMVGGKGPTEDDILRMLEEPDQETGDEVEETDNSNEPTEESTKTII